MLKNALIIFSLLFVTAISQAEKATTDEYAFDSNAQEKEYRVIISQLRCPKCQNQTIADSDAELSEDLRFIVYQKLKRGESRQQIFSYFQKRYGDFILYNPPVSPQNYLLWFMPIVVFLIIIASLILKVGRRKLTPEDNLEEETKDNSKESD